MIPRNKFEFRKLGQDLGGARVWRATVPVSPTHATKLKNYFCDVAYMILDTHLYPMLYPRVYPHFFNVQATKNFKKKSLDKTLDTKLKKFFEK